MVRLNDDSSWFARLTAALDLHGRCRENLECDWSEASFHIKLFLNQINAVVRRLVIYDLVSMCPRALSRNVAGDAVISFV